MTGWFRAPLAASLFWLSACGGGGEAGGGSTQTGNETDGAVAAGDLAVWLSADAVSMSSGGTASLTLTLLRGSGVDGSVDLSVVGSTTAILPSLGAASVTDSTTSLDLQAIDGLPQGRYPLTIVARHGNQLRTCLLVVTVVGSANFSISAPPFLAIQPGSSTGVPVELQHAFGSTGLATLSLLNPPPDFSAVFVANPLRNAMTEMILQATGATPPGTHLVDVAATIGSATVISRMTVHVAAPTEVGDVTIARIDLAQTVVEEDPVLISNKSCLLRVHAVADRAGYNQVAVVVTGTAAGQVLGHLNLVGPFAIPVAVDGEDLASCYRVTLPASWMVVGLHLRVEIDPDQQVSEREKVFNQREWNPRVQPGTVLPLTLVPIQIGQNVATVNDFRASLVAILPISDAQIEIHPVFVPDSVAGNTIEEAEWYTLLAELGSLQASEAPERYYYGLIPAAADNSPIAGLGYIGQPAAVGLDYSGDALAHELGHNFGLYHAPCGVSGDNLYPYPYGGIGTLGYDRVNDVLVPTSSVDIMSYCWPPWISDYNYEKMETFLRDSTAPLAAATQEQPLLHVSGAIHAGSLSLKPIYRGTGRQYVPSGGSHILRLVTAGGHLDFPFAPRQLATCSAGAAGHAHFALALPDPGPLSALEVYKDGILLQRVVQTYGVGLDAASDDPQLAVLEKDGRLKITWNAARFSHVRVVHRGDRRLVLGVQLKRGSADLSTSGLPAGGSLEFSFSRGLETLQLVRGR